MIDSNQHTAAGAGEASAAATGPGASRRAVAMLQDRLRATGDQAVLTVRGHCMGPLIEDGDQVLVSGIQVPPPPGTVVVAAGESGEIVCHRVIDHAATGDLVLCGDRSSATAVLPVRALVGAVNAVCRGRLLRLDGPLQRGLGRLAARCHRLELRHRGSPRRLTMAMLYRACRRATPVVSSLGWLLAAPAQPSDHTGPNEEEP